MVVNGDGNVPEGEGAGIDAVKHLLILVPDDFLEGTNRLCHCDFDRKDLASIVAINETVEFEGMRIRLC
jgi:hypothetical protein